MLSCGFNIRESLNVVLCKTVSCGFCRSCFKVVKVAVLNLIIGKSFSHVVENVDGELLSFRIGHILAEPLSVETDLIHTDETDC